MVDSHFNYIAHTDFYHNFLSLVSRLRGVTQLGIIQFEDKWFGATHTRFEHSLLTAELGEVILHAHDVSPDQIRLMVASCILHDAATPPYSDQGKAANRDALDEEENLALVVSQPPVEEMLKTYDISPGDVLAVARGTYPVLGSLLNSNGIDVDKMAYVIWDAVITGAHTPIHLYTEGLNDLYEDIFLDDGRVVFSDADRVAQFLFVRALLFTQVYRNPQTSAREAFFSSWLQDLWKKGVLTRENMTAMTNADLDSILLKDNSNWYQTLHNIGTDFDEIARFPGDASLEAIRNQYPSPNLVARQHTFNTATTTLVRNRGAIMPFAEARPFEANELGHLSRGLDYIGVYRLVY